MFRTIKQITRLLAGFLLLALAACASVGPASTASLANTAWTLVSYGKPGSEQSIVPDTSVTLKLDADGKASGSGGCNSYGGGYELKDQTIVFNNVAATLMACADSKAMQQETDFFHALGAAGTFDVSQNSLKIYYDNKSGVLIFSKTPTP